MEKLRRVVHFGPEMRLPGTGYGRKIKPGEVHYCIDVRPGFASEAKSDAEAARLLKRRKMRLAEKSAEETGLRSGSVDEVHIHNLLNVPCMRHARHVEEPCEAKVRSAERLLVEAGRIIRKDGCVFVGATNTPYFFPREALEKAAERLGLKPACIVADQSRETIRQDIPILSEHVGRVVEPLVHPGYYLVKLTKR